MKQELLKRINPVIESFVDEILSSFEDIEKIRQELTQKENLYQDLIAQKERELSNIRINKSNEKQELDKRITELERSKSEHIEKANIYQSLIDEIDRKRKGAEDDLSKARIELIRAKDVRLQADKQKDQSEKVKRDYELKLNSLKQDFDKNEAESKRIEAERSKLTARENDIFKNEAKQNEKSKELSDRELKLKAERKEVDRLVKRYNLEKQLQEK